MIFHSLLSKITLIFAIAFLLLVGHFFAFQKLDSKRQHRGVVQEHKKLSFYFKRNRLPRFAVLEYTKELGFTLEKNHREVLKKGRIVFNGRGFETIFYEGQYYFHVLTPHFRLLLKDVAREEVSMVSLPWLVFGSMLLLLLGVYIWLLKSLKPLYELKEHINQFAQGNLDIDCKSSKKDEIADVANEFDNAVKQIKLLLNSRQLFLRTVMHELKTPIAKGRIVAELIPEEKQKERMALIFEKLDFLINDFAKIEQVVSKNYDVYKSEYALNTVLHHAFSMLMLDNHDKVELKTDLNQKICVDIELMAMVFKNLIDNAFKYANDKSITIEEKENEILFISNGVALSRPLESYFKPFHNETEDKNHGMGLGLYIVKSILQLHDMELKYEHNDGINIFRIVI